MSIPERPADAVVWCEQCRRWTRRGEPYRMIAPGRFAHRLCAVPDLETPEEAL